MGKYKVPEGYFNATEMIVADEKGVKLKVHHFLDNLKIRRRLEAIGKEPVIYRGRGACTLVPNELKTLFIAWMALNTEGEV